jgi:hypothetical protein
METYDDRVWREYRFKILGLIEQCDRIEQQADILLEGIDRV